ncbi:hypothetical protein KUTeg_000792 [Tegillarca granosa]|uniref:Uncharacterized protein n=1 Tax=Tegillarca granosa TaxID=220873 RepID=A0ABQ9FZV7_TEGGR|nr:hypothetical protein KUTeg_000792 [Tegillarca granosa]
MLQQAPLIPALGVQQSPLIPALRVQQSSLITALRVQQFPLIPALREQLSPLIQALGVQQFPLIPALRVQQSPLIQALRLQQSPLIPALKEQQSTLIPALRVQTSLIPALRVSDCKQIKSQILIKCSHLAVIEVVDENRKQPTIEQIASMEEYLPTRTQHLTILQPTGVIFFAEHAQCDVGKKSYRTSQTNKKKQDQDEKPLVSSLPCIHISAARFDLQVTKPMYPRKLVRMISMIAGPSSNLLHHCHTHTQVKVFGLEAGLVRIDQSGNKSHVVTVIPPCSGALYTRHLLLSMKNTQLPKLEQMYELPQISINITKANLLLGLRIWSSWQQNLLWVKIYSLWDISLLPTEPLTDFADSHSFDEQEGPKSPLIEVTVSGFEMKKCRSTLVTAYTGTISSVQAILYGTDLNFGKHTIT